MYTSAVYNKFIEYDLRLMAALHVNADSGNNNPPVNTTRKNKSNFNVYEHKPRTRPNNRYQGSNARPVFQK